MTRLVSRSVFGLIRSSRFALSFQAKEAFQIFGLQAKKKAQKNCLDTKALEQRTKG